MVILLILWRLVKCIQYPVVNIVNCLWGYVFDCGGDVFVFWRWRPWRVYQCRVFGAWGRRFIILGHVCRDLVEKHTRIGDSKLKTWWGYCGNLVISSRSPGDRLAVRSRIDLRNARWNINETDGGRFLVSWDIFSSIEPECTSFMSPLNEYLRWRNSRRRGENSDGESVWN